MNLQGWFPLGLTGLISLLSKGLSGVFSSTTVWKHHFFGTHPSLWSKSHICTWLLEDNSFEYTNFVRKVLSLLFNMLSVCYHKHATVVYWLVWAVALEKQQIQGSERNSVFINFLLRSWINQGRLILITKDTRSSHHTNKPSHKLSSLSLFLLRVHWYFLKSFVFHKLSYKPLTFSCYDGHLAWILNNLWEFFFFPSWVVPMYT